MIWKVAWRSKKPFRYQCSRIIDR